MKLFDPENIAFDTTIIATVWVIKEFCRFSFGTAAILDFIIS
jgi:hypothetical protein